MRILIQKRRFQLKKLQPGSTVVTLDDMKGAFPYSISMEILYKDDAVTVINKPSGLLIHRSPLSSDTDTVVDRLKELFENPPSPIHRLDRPASGILLAASNSDTARILCQAFIESEVQKTYHAIVRGWVEEPGEIDIPLKKEKSRQKGKGEEQEALSRYWPLLTTEVPVGNNRFPTSRYSLIKAEPVTGRYHQLRRHLARISHPIIGDTAHGDLRHNKLIQDYCQNQRLLLHAYSIKFPHPHTGEIIEIEAPYPDEFVRVKEGLFKNI